MVDFRLWAKESVATQQMFFKAVAFGSHHNIFGIYTKGLSYKGIYFFK